MATQLMLMISFDHPNTNSALNINDGQTTNDQINHCTLVEMSLVSPSSQLPWTLYHIVVTITRILAFI